MRLLLAAAIAAGAALLMALPAMATTGKGQLFHDGTVVGTVVEELALSRRGHCRQGHEQGCPGGNRSGE